MDISFNARVGLFPGDLLKERAQKERQDMAAVKRREREKIHHRKVHGDECTIVRQSDILAIVE